MFRDAGGDLNVVNQIGISDLTGEPYINGLETNEFPVSSVGLSFVFKVRVITTYSTLGVDSAVSSPMILAGVPDTPTTGPS